MINIFEAFAGYGGGTFALNKAKIPHKIIGYSEIDKYASQCFEQNHGNIKAYGDITKIDWEQVPDFDLLTGGFPCQDLSQAGKQDLKKGRSVLVFELIKALEIKQPKYFLFENVAAIQQEKFREFLSLAENGMKNAGYKVYRKSLNTRNFGIPQNRERVWFIGYRNDVAPQFGFVPYPIETGCKLRLLDLCDKVVDEKYYLSQKAVKRLINEFKGYHSKINPDIGSTLFSSQHKIARGMDLIASPIELTKNLPQAERVYSLLGSSVTLKSGGEGLGAKTGLYVFPCAIRQRDRHGKNQEKEQQLEVGKDNVNSLTSVQKDSLLLLAKEGKIRIRRLTPIETFRLMGFKDGEIKVNGISETQQYKLSGNGWDVNLVSKIFKAMKI